MESGRLCKGSWRISAGNLVMKFMVRLHGPRTRLERKRWKQWVFSNKVQSNPGLIILLDEMNKKSQAKRPKSREQICSVKQNAKLQRHQRQSHGHLPECQQDSQRCSPEVQKKFKFSLLWGRSCNFDTWVESVCGWRSTLSVSVMYPQSRCDRKFIRNSAVATRVVFSLFSLSQLGNWNTMNGEMQSVSCFEARVAANLSIERSVRGRTTEIQNSTGRCSSLESQTFTNLSLCGNVWRRGFSVTSSLQGISAFSWVRTVYTWDEVSLSWELVWCVWTKTFATTCCYWWWRNEYECATLQWTEWTRVCSSAWPLACPSLQFVLALHALVLSVEEPKDWWKIPASKKKEAEQLEFLKHGQISEKCLDLAHGF